MAAKRAAFDGKKLKAACWKCEKFQPATFAYGSMEHDGVQVERTLRATCDICGEVIATTAESAADIRMAIAEQKGRTSFLVSTEVLKMAAEAMRKRPEFHGSDIQAAVIFVKAYLGTLVDNPARMSRAVRKAKELPPGQLVGKKDKIVTLRASAGFFHALDDFGRRIGAEGWGQPFRLLLILALNSADALIQCETKKLATIYA